MVTILTACGGTALVCCTTVQDRYTSPWLQFELLAVLPLLPAAQRYKTVTCHHGYSLNCLWCYCPCLSCNGTRQLRITMFTPACGGTILQRSHETFFKLTCHLHDGEKGSRKPVRHRAFYTTTTAALANTLPRMNTHTHAGTNAACTLSLCSVCVCFVCMRAIYIYIKFV